MGTLIVLLVLIGLVWFFRSRYMAMKQHTNPTVDWADKNERTDFVGHSANGLGPLTTEKDVEEKIRRLIQNEAQSDYKSGGGYMDLKIVSVAVTPQDENTWRVESVYEVSTKAESVDREIPTNVFRVIHAVDREGNLKQVSRERSVRGNVGADDQRSGGSTMGDWIVVFLFLAVIVGGLWFFRYMTTKQRTYLTTGWTNEYERSDFVGRDENGTVQWAYHFLAPVDQYTYINYGGREKDYQAPGESIPHRLWYLITQATPAEGKIIFAKFANPEIPDRIVNFDLMTGPRWEKTYREIIGPLADQFKDDWEQKDGLQFSLSGSQKIAVLVRHRSGWPSVVVVLNDSGAVLGRFAHAGPLESLSLHTGNQGSWSQFLLMAGGLSTSRNAPVLIVLDALHVTGSSPEEAGSRYVLKDSEPPGAGLLYYVFPRTELEVARGEKPEPVLGTGFDDWKGGYGHFCGVKGAQYVFSEDFLELRGSWFNDDYWRRHEELESAGHVTHSREQCPEREGPRAVRAWVASKGWHDVPALGH